MTITAPMSQPTATARNSFADCRSARSRANGFMATQPPTDPDRMDLTLRASESATRTTEPGTVRSGLNLMRERLAAAIPSSRHSCREDGIPRTLIAPLRIGTLPGAAGPCWRYRRRACASPCRPPKPGFRIRPRVDRSPCRQRSSSRRWNRGQMGGARTAGTLPPWRVRTRTPAGAPPTIAAMPGLPRLPPPGSVSSHPRTSHGPTGAGKSASASTSAIGSAWTCP